MDINRNINQESPLICRLYICGPVSLGVADSQMINWALLLEDEGIYTEFYIFYNKNNHSKYQKMRSSQYGRKYHGRKYYNILFLRELVFLLHLSKIMILYRKKNINTIVQTRTTIFTIPLLILSIFFSFKIIYEIRGTGETNNSRNSFSNFYNNFNEKLLIKRSQGILAVSNVLLTYKLNKYKIDQNAHKTKIIYGAADSNLFWFSKPVRQQKRSEYKLSNKLVLLYIGMLDKEWQIPDKVFYIVSELMKVISNLFFVVLTPDIQTVKDYCKKYKIDENNLLISEKSQNELVGFVNMADFGLLLREDKLVNNVASPTKFAEYLLGGLPIIITEGIGDYTELLKKHNLGISINLEHLDVESLSRQITHRSFNRQNIESIGKELFSKQNYLPELVKFFRQPFETKGPK